MTDLPSVEVLRLRPGDVLVCESVRSLTLDEARDVKAKLEAAFPGYPVVVVDSELTLKVTRREDVE